MSINKDNYEEYFLLYIDGELDTAAQLAVEDFIQQNADLAAEFDMLMSTKFSPETIEFADKENLIRTEGNNINETNYQEYFLLYIDNELSAAKREEVEMYVLKHPKLQDEFITLKQAVLAPEIISYGDKSDLYRAERRRSIYLRPMYIAAAAIFIGVCALGIWMMQPSYNVTVPPVANNQPVKDNTTSKTADTIQRQTTQQPIIPEKSLPKRENKIATGVVKRNDRNITRKSLQQDAGNKQPEVVDVPPVIERHDIITQPKEPPVELHDIAAIPQKIREKQMDAAALQVPETEPNNNYTVYPVAYKELNTNDEDRSLHVGMFDLNKTKVKTLFKRAGRVLGNRSNDFANEDGKLQVANFEIETKKQ